MRQFRYDCCNRLDPSPCYVGRHVRSSGGRSDHNVNMAVTCNCGSRATIRRTKKENDSKHRLFFTCLDRSCNFFSRCDEAFNLPARRYGKASDGVDEHRYLHANPFGENLVGPGSSPETYTMYQRRRRLVAAVLVNSIQLQADGHTGYTCSSNLFEQLFGEGDFASLRPNDPFECWTNDSIEQASVP